MLIPSEIIKIKRNGGELTTPDLEAFIKGFLEGTVADYQMSAFLMAVFFQGMTRNERTSLTDVMMKSGSVIDWPAKSGPLVDKHSTGGVGDKTSLIIAPLAAACGIKVPMISGRGLGHTGGTLDKLESIPGFNVNLTIDEFKKQVGKLGLAFMGQTKEICPVDKWMYALRDVTGTVESVDLICASIMSKKLAEGLDGLVLDIKVGSGAFMKSFKDAWTLARGLVEIGTSKGVAIHALVTNMNQPLGKSVGNALEVQECIDVLSGVGPEDLRELSIVLAAHMVLLGKKAKTFKEARVKVISKLQDGSALMLLKEVIAYQGGDLSSLPSAKIKYDLLSSKSGIIHSIDTEQVGIAALTLGASRMKIDDIIDPSAGLIIHKRLGEAVSKDEALVSLYYDTKLSNHMVNNACLKLRGAIAIKPGRGRKEKLILGEIKGKAK